MKRNLSDRRIYVACAAMAFALLLLARSSFERVVSAQSGSGESNANTSTPKKPPVKKPVAKKPIPKKNPTGNANGAQSAEAAADERTYWESIRSSADPADFRAYLKEYPNGKYITLANNRLKSLEAASTTSHTNSSTSPPARGTSAVKPIRNRTGIEMVWIPPGSFDMGSNNGESNEKPVHRVTIGQGFFMGKYEVTQGQWQAVMGSNPSTFKGDENLPLENVSWNDAQEFINKLNETDDGYRYRLPTEAEWEYACRAGTTGDYYAQDPDDIAWYSDNAGKKTHRVGAKQPNAFGLYDMSGNVWEWCRDWYVGRYETAPTDGSARLSKGEQDYRVLRGSSYAYEAARLRSAFRGYHTPDLRVYDHGFRLVAVARSQ